MSDPDYGLPPHLQKSPKVQPRDGDYALSFPIERPGDRQTAKNVFKRNGCKSVRFEKRDQMLIAHGYIVRIHGDQMEDL